MSRLAPLVTLLSLTACFEPTAPARLYACNDDGTCPARYTCDQPFDGPAVCCIPGVLTCPTLRAPDSTCADGSKGRPYQRDRDGDGYGNASDVVIRCARPKGFAAAGAMEDCDDADVDVNPMTAEACNGVDDNCDGVIDEGLSPREAYLRDEDGDCYPELDGGVLACMAPPGTVRAQGALNDCQPFSPSQHPDAGERCNGLDDDCDGSTVASRYVDTQLLSEPVRFPCLVPNARGVCVDGVLTCPTGAMAVCTALRGPSAETCDGIDTDCDGALDNQPGCGGPPSLVNQPTLRYGGGMVPGGTGLFDRCQKNRVTAAGTNVNGRLTGARNGDVSLVWWAEATSDAGWDLSAENLRLRLSWTATGTSPSATRGLWGIAGTGAGEDGVHPVVYLCGEADSDLVRYRWEQATTSFKLNETSFSGLLHLDPAQPDGGFVLGLGSGFDTRRVRRVEVMVRFLGATYDFSMQPPTGFVK
ncbi:MAG: putative metal-binding motif-containing protein [Myxococcus sp.]|nr:putative metal-binding motif-containing protein [Myxococcus sp.]